MYRADRVHTRIDRLCSQCTGFPRNRHRVVSDHGGCTIHSIGTSHCNEQRGAANDRRSNHHPSDRAYCLDRVYADTAAHSSTASRCYGNAAAMSAAARRY